MVEDRPRPGMGERRSARATARSIWSKAASELWLASMTMPSRFISATHCRPSGDRPFQRASPVVESASWLVRLWTGPAMRRPSRWKVVSRVRSLAERPAILHADEGDALALAVQPLGVGGGQREADLVAILADHPVDRGGPDQRRVARLGIAGRGQLALRGVDDEEAAIEPARRHPRQIDLAAVLGVAVELRRNPSGRRRSASGMSRWVSSTIIRSCACAVLGGHVAAAGPRREWRGARARAGRVRMRIGELP